MHRCLALVLVVTLLGTLAGCVGHVRAFEKEQLAHPTMTPEDISVGLDGHVRAVSEGAIGGLAGAGGGCGCN
ncbi:hypothetical protein BH11MYX4_BH11MYX4_22510 [soil metagenome]